MTEDDPRNDGADQKRYSSILADELAKAAERANFSILAAILRRLGRKAAKARDAKIEAPDDQ